MTPDEMRKAIIRIARRTTAEQGLPERLEDPSIIVRVGRILRRALEEGDDGGKRK
jgi:hypothetical protein